MGSTSWPSIRRTSTGRGTAVSTRSRADTYVTRRGPSAPPAGHFVSSKRSFARVAGGCVSGDAGAVLFCVGRTSRGAAGEGDEGARVVNAEGAEGVEGEAGRCRSRAISVV